MQMIFEPPRREGTAAVLSGKCGPKSFPDTRDRLARWPVVRDQVLRNLEAIEREYDPFSSAITALRGHMSDSMIADLALWSARSIREFLAVPQFVARARTAVLSFDLGIRLIASESISIDELAERYEELLDAYGARRLIPVD